ncbi:MAG: heme lyase CcmF/NrfE family subunit [Thiobacillaceae bacterium]|nr:heme lyase CcmF/NrfE family subunit [Thiobacillaceae bacterium]MCX7672679.1 heme lyase CcmF/NrfE family subunit [Thiobacillaceae bacterium]MDW8323712.1 heme lyase CcmF/NrfE family subunit [Burkholderiales bacterium]
MIPELGHFALIVALLLALVQGVLPLVGAHRGNATLMAVARPAAHGQFVFVALAFAALAYSFLTNDFSVENVARNSYSRLPEVYRFTATWGSHEGSLLLWTLILAFWTVAVTVFSRHLPQDMAARVIGVMGLVSVGFLAFMLFTSNPFLRLLPPVPEGNDMNPLLQDPGMVIHPPMLYMGYVGFSVAFAFAIAALLSGKLDAAWARWSRPWTTVAWLFLTLGIALGSWWAYYELGWGGWWFWDPTENASFMPWLAGTALIHSLAVTEKRGAFKSWTVLLAITTFSLSLLGTFLVRSGVLSSVHAFATDPGRGVFILAFLAIVIGGSLLLYAWRAPHLMTGGGFTWFSREALLLANNVLLMAAMATVLLGTLYPLFMDALGLGKISVGPPYFNAVFIPLIAPVLFLTAVGPLTRWKGDSLPSLALRLKWAFAVALAVAALLPLTLDGMKPWASLGLFLALWILFGVAMGFVERLKHAQGGWAARLAGLPRAFWGMQIAHTGLAVVVIGATVVSNYEAQRDVRMAAGDHVDLAGYRFLFMGAEPREGPNYSAMRGTMEVWRGERKVAVVHPEKRKYHASGMVMTEAGIDYGVFRDVYVSLGEPLDETTWVVQVYYKPFVGWLWGGAALLALGGALAASDRRYRIALRREMRTAGVAEGARA